MLAGLSIQFFVLCTMSIVCIYSKEYLLEDLLAVENNNRRTVTRTEVANIANSEPEVQKLSRQRQVNSARQKKADDGGTVEEEGGGGSVANVNGGKKNNSSSANKDDDDEDKKTLAQQVADGKYGLIQKEIFPEAPKRPGIISYEVNPEVPRDNVNNLGGLKPEEIWLAENHLLVLAGGGKYSEGRDDTPVWPPIDNYKAPPRQVKIPPNPKVPPPFPVQLRPGGPIEFLRGENGTGGPPQFPPFFPPGNFTGTGLPPSPFISPPPGFHPGNLSLGNGPATPFPFPPFPPQLQQGISNGTLRPPPPPGAFPPGANFLPPPGNFTGQLDEDDPSIYYPPPYDFVYKRENTTVVPPGPLVPGIILPPPPDFFAPLEDEKQRAKPKRPTHKSKRPQQTQTPYRGKADYRYPTTTKRPAVQIVTDEPSQQLHLNEVTPATLEHILPPNAEVRGWVPIPAPRPFYITGPRKQLVKNPDFQNIQNEYQYDKPGTDSFGAVPLRVQSNYDQNGNRDGNIFIHPTTTISPVPYHSTPIAKIPAASRGKSVKSYYFYDDPNRLISTQAPVPFENYYSTPRPVELQPQPPQYYSTTVRPSPRPFQAEQPARPEPVQYFYITKPPPSIEATTRKPPIYEYSYTAPGYGTLEAPKLSGVSTPAPPVYQVPPAQQYDLNFRLYDAPTQSSTRPPLRLPYSTTAAPIVHSTTIRPNTYNKAPKTTSSPYIVQTENPYHYFTHHDFSLIDDITKKYFTIFGQKINSADGATTPLSPTVGANEVTTKSPLQKLKGRVQFPVEHQQPTPIPPSGQNDYSYYWSTPRPATGSGSRPGHNVYPQYTSDYDYYDDSNYNIGSLGFSNFRNKLLQDILGYGGVGNRVAGGGGADYDESRPAALVQQQNQPSYEGDTRVNFVQPLPPKNPDAEEFSAVPLKSRRPQSRPTSNEFVGRLRPQTEPPPSLNDDINVNYVNTPTPNPDAEVFDPSKLNPRYQQYNSYSGRLQNNVVTIRPPSLQDDTRVNYVNPQPTQDPNAEVFDPTQLNQRYRNRGNRPSNLYLIGRYQQHQQQQSQQPAGLVPSPRPPTLEGDTNVNYLSPRPPINPDAEILNPRTRQQLINNLFNEFVGRAQESLADDTKVNDGLKGQTPDPDALVFDPKNPPQPDFGGRQGDIIAYRLPGNGGHFYFLTPQTAVQQVLKYRTPDAVQQNLYRRNVRRQSGSRPEESEEVEQEEEKEERRISRTEESRRKNSRSNSNNILSNNNNRNNTNTENHTT